MPAAAATQTFDQRTTIHALTAVESAFLDLMGQALGVPVAKLLGDGQQRDSVEVLGYLFFVGDHRRTKLDYHETADTCRRLGACAHRGSARRDSNRGAGPRGARAVRLPQFKLKGGVLDGPAECECIARWPRRFPAPGSRSTPTAVGAWPMRSSGSAPLKSVLTYAEDPCGAEDGRSGCEVLAEFRRATGIPTATNMVAIDFPGLVEAISSTRSTCRWPIATSGRCAARCA